MTFHNQAARIDADNTWVKARRKAFITQVTAAITREEKRLVNFNEISKQLNLQNYRYLGTQTIPVADIVGSIGRYQDFLAGFLPKNKGMRERWQGVARHYLQDIGTGLPPIEVFKVGKSYFVRDGNHRVSVCNSLGITLIEAYVWEYRIELEAACDGDELDRLLLAAEHQDFLSQTNLATLLPAADIRLTLPGGYITLLQDIAHYQEILSEIDETEVSFADAVVNWYEMRYEPILAIANRHGVLEHYTDRTEADLYVFVTREHAKLKANENHRVRMTQAVKAVEARQRGFLQHWMWQLRNRFSPTGE